ncbi:hypothetical protein Ancab_034721 [Ancistrocladus abbreviatus]
MESSTASVSALVSELLASADSLAKESPIEIETDALTEFSQKLTQMLNYTDVIAVSTPRIRNIIESLEAELRRVRDFVRSSPNSEASSESIKEVLHEVERFLGELLNMVEVDLDLTGEKIDGNGSVDQYCGSEELEVLSDGGGREIEEEGGGSVKIDDIVLQLKYGSEEELKFAVGELGVLIRENRVDGQWISDEGIVPILFNRLGSTNCVERVGIIETLRSIVLQNDESKEKMADVTSLTILVKSLARGAVESREAVGLLMDLSNLTAVRRRIGKIKGCILMLVTILNGDDVLASRKAGMLLNSLSQNTQNALHMAEAGYFNPLVQHLKEGSEMSKILMASALSKMVLIDQNRTLLGEIGVVEPLIMMFKTGKLEAKLSALNALRNLSTCRENVALMIASGILSPLLQLLFSVTSSLVSLREPAAALLERIAQSEPTLINKDVACQMLSLLSLSSPVIQCHLLQALSSTAADTRASKLRSEMKQNGVLQLLLPFLSDSDGRIRASALNLIYSVSEDYPEALTQLLGEDNIRTIVLVISSSSSYAEKAAAVSLLSNIIVGDKKVTDILKRENWLPVLLSIMSSNVPSSAPAICWLVESIAKMLIWFTDPSDKKLQLYAAELGVIPLLLKLLTYGSTVAKYRAATSLAQLSQNSVSLRRSRRSRCFCIPSSGYAFCEVHNGYCTVKGSFCLVKAGAIRPLILTLEGEDREADEAILGCLATLLQDSIWEKGSSCIAEASGVEAIVKILESGTVKAKERALWILDRIFRAGDYKIKYGESAQVVLISLAHKGDPTLKPMIARVLAQLELLQLQSSYF